LFSFGGAASGPFLIWFLPPVLHSSSCFDLVVCRPAFPGFGLQPVLVFLLPLWLASILVFFSTVDFGSSVPPAFRACDFPQVRWSRRSHSCSQVSAPAKVLHLPCSDLEFRSLVADALR
jgi:hypothetical protein